MWAKFRNEHKGQGLSLKELSEKYKASKKTQANPSSDDTFEKYKASKKNQAKPEEKFEKKTLSYLFTPKNKESQEFGLKFTIITSSGPQKDLVFEKGSNSNVFVYFQRKVWNLSGPGMTYRMARIAGLSFLPEVSIKGLFEVYKDGTPTEDAFKLFEEMCQSQYMIDTLKKKGWQ